MMRPSSIASVTLAYNSEQLLPKQLDVLLRQSRRLDEVIVVNNASADDTLRLLAERYPQVTVVDLPSNLGAGGGYAAGLEYAAKRKRHDWVWLLDCDSVPAETALEVLEQALETTEVKARKVGILASLATNAETGDSYPGALWKNGLVPVSADSGEGEICFVDAAIHSGMLVSREVVEQVGVPREDFFVDFTDFEYCLRARRKGFHIAMVRGSRLDHAIGNPRSVRIGGYSKPWTDHVPWREYYFSRNYTFMVWNDYPDWRCKLFVFRKLVRHAAAVLLFGQCKAACLKMMWLGFLDGRTGRLGVRFHGDVQPLGPQRNAELTHS